MKGKVIPIETGPVTQFEVTPRIVPSNSTTLYLIALRSHVAAAGVPLRRPNIRPRFRGGTLAGPINFTAVRRLPRD